ncbi:MAG: hypothetical protein K2Q22_04865 [Cytophagales bacterium]|nr:hypothetical protein [Cytophagales bacterium]
MKNKYVKVFIYTILGSICFLLGEIHAQVDKNLVAYNDNTTVMAQKPLNFDLSVFRNNVARFQPRIAIKDTNSVLEKLVNNLNVDGQVRFSTIYRNMSQAYADMTTSNQNISFVDYPISNSGAAQLAGYPMLELRFGSRFSKNIDFNVGYSFFHSFTGATDVYGGKSLSVVNNLKFNGNVLTPIGKFTVNAGAGLTAALSRFTVGLP